MADNPLPTSEVSFCDQALCSQHAHNARIAVCGREDVDKIRGRKLL
jgi:hypothetical protein